MTTEPDPPPKADRPPLGTVDSAALGAVDVLVVLWDPETDRRKPVEALIRGCGARVLTVDTLPALEELAFATRCSIAVAGLRAMGASETPEDDFDVVRHLKQKGFMALVYAEGVRSWPLDLRCRTLVAGAAQLFDCLSPGFAAEFQGCLRERLQAQLLKKQREDEVRSVMDQLEIVGISTSLLSVFQRLLRASSLSDVPVLITGETGTGKELFARALYRLDVKRRTGPFVAVNCGALSTGLLQSELFGHRRGAFTGAEQTRKGLIRSADAGVLFLDEIGELDTPSQVKLLRVLQENCVLPVGEDRDVPVSIRVVAATNRNLREMVVRKEFREDLFHRINVVSIHIPPLRERLEDIEPLVDHFLLKHQSMAGGRRLKVQEEFVSALKKLQLPGNARQLENLVRQVLVNKGDDSVLTLTDLPEEIWQNLAQLRGDSDSVWTESPKAGDQNSRRSELALPLSEFVAHYGANLAQSLQFCEKLLLQTALHKSQGNQSQAARMLGITPRSVYNKLRKYRLAS
jgi:transcriptional regulator with PAS, ATPase and Fis domain